jgi:hypothetical protein
MTSQGTVADARLGRPCAIPAQAEAGVVEIQADAYLGAVPMNDEQQITTLDRKLGSGGQRVPEGDSE